MIINFNQNNNYLLDIRDCLGVSNLWVSIDIVDHTLWIDDDYVSLSHACHLLQLDCSIPVDADAPIDQLYDACNAFNSSGLSKALFDNGAIHLRIDLSTKGGVACKALLATTESLYLDMLTMEEHLEACELSKSDY
jgi:hypothetical protein